MTLHDRTDKVENGYLPTYLRLAERLGPSANVCEVGVQRGGSLELWQVLFPHGHHTGIDIDPEAVHPPGTTRITASQDDPRLPALLPRFSYDLIVDDASHEAKPTLRTFELLWPCVAPGGSYVIEDWGVAFPGNAPMHDPDFLSAILQLFDQLSETEVESVTLRTGLIVITRK
jgi:hypothetical protein